MKLPITIYNSLIPFKGFVAMQVLCFLFIRKEFKGDDNTLDKQFFNHEGIHCFQQTELAILGFILSAIIVLVFNISYWWLLTCIPFPFVVYLLCWVIELFTPGGGAYRQICFESEAIYNEGDPECLSKRKLMTFRFLKYISNKKYPYIYKSQRAKLWSK